MFLIIAASPDKSLRVLENVGARLRHFPYRFQIDWPPD
jgi:hypothetical protein